MSKLQEIPHLETCPRSFSFNIPYKDKVLLFSLRRNRVSQKKNTRKQRFLILRETMTQIKVCRFNILFRGCFFPEKQSKSKSEVLYLFYS